MRVKTKKFDKWIALLCCVLLVAMFFLPQFASARAEENAQDAAEQTEESTRREETIFGKWQSGTWAIEPKLDYSIADLAEIKNYAILGDYESAKAELLRYYKRRDTVKPVSPEAGTSMAADLLTQNILFWNFSEYYSYTTVTDAEDWYKFNVQSGVNLGQSLGLELIARGKHDNVAVFGSRESGFAPYLELTINGIKTVVYPTKDATIRGGDYNKENYGSAATLEVNDTGLPSDSDTRRAILVFDLSRYSGLVTSADLYVHGGLSASGSVEIMAAGHANVAFDESKLAWSTADLRVFSWEGNMFAWDWGAPDGCAIQYQNALMTLGFVANLLNAYHDTRRAVYAEKAIEIVVCLARHAGDDPKYGNDALRLGSRGMTMTNYFGYLVKTPYMTKEQCFDIVYYMWIQGSCLGDPYLEYPRFVSDQGYASYAYGNNWGVTQTTGLYYTSHYFYEFVGSDAWQTLAVNRISDLIDVTINVDGSYVEDCSGYVGVTLGSVLDIVEFAKLNGFMLNPSTETRIMNLLRYVVTFSMPNTYEPNYGDSSLVSTIGTVRPFVDLYGEEGPLLYYVTRGVMGTEPDWTSAYYPNMRWAIMRSGWDEDDLYMHINTQSGTHNHWDSNAVIMYAYGRNLLIDSGRKSYDNDEQTLWQRQNVESHNTLQMNDEAGLASRFTNEVRGYDSTSSADFYQGYNTQASASTAHTRTVLMLKDGFYIVSDYAVDSRRNQTYNLNWHYPVSSNPEIDTEHNKTYTTFGTGANLQVISSVAPDLISEREGVFTAAAVGEAIPYSFMKYSYNRENLLNVSTLLYPTREGDTQDVTMQAIDTSDNAQNAQAAVINFDSTRGYNTAYYYLSNENSPRERGFGDYSTDGGLVYVEYDKDDNPVHVIFRGGTSLVKNSADVISSPLALAFVTADYSGSSLSLEGNLIPCTDAEFAMRIYAPKAESVTVNGQSVEFVRDGDYIYAARSSEEEDEAELLAAARALPELADLTVDHADAVAEVRTASYRFDAKGYTVPVEVEEILAELEEGLVFLNQVADVEYDMSVLMPDGITLDTVTTAKALWSTLNNYAANYAHTQEVAAYLGLKEKIEGYIAEGDKLLEDIEDKAHVITYDLSESCAESLNREQASGAEKGAGQGFNGFYYYYMTNTGVVQPMTYEGANKYQGSNGAVYWDATGGRSLGGGLTDNGTYPTIRWAMSCWVAPFDCTVQYDFTASVTQFMSNGDGAYVYISRGTLSGGYPAQPKKVVNAVGGNQTILTPADNLLFSSLVGKTNLAGNPVTYSAVFNLKAGEAIWIATDPNQNTSYDGAVGNARIKVISGATAVEGVTAEDAFAAMGRIQDAMFSLPAPEDVTLDDAVWIKQVEDDSALFTDPSAFYRYDEYLEVREAFLGLGASLSSNSFAVTVLPSEGGTLSVAQIYNEADSIVVVTATPLPGYEFVKDSIALNGEPYDSAAFVMPAEDVVVSARFERISYSVTAVDKDGATVKLQQDTAHGGDKIHYSIRVPYGYRVREGSVKVNGVAVTEDSFVMPAANAELTYELEKIEFAGEGGCGSSADVSSAAGYALSACCVMLALVSVGKRRRDKKC